MVPSYRVSLSLSLSTRLREGGFVMPQDLARSRIRTFGRNLPRCRTLANRDHSDTQAGSILVAKCYAVTHWQIATIFLRGQAVFWSRYASLSQSGKSRPFSDTSKRHSGRNLPRCRTLAVRDRFQVQTTEISVVKCHAATGRHFTTIHPSRRTFTDCGTSPPRTTRPGPCPARGSDGAWNRRTTHSGSSW